MYIGSEKIGENSVLAAEYSLFLDDCKTIFFSYLVRLQR